MCGNLGERLFETSSQNSYNIEVSKSSQLAAPTSWATICQCIAARCPKGEPVGRLDGQTAIVTGAARGLGRAYAHRLASLGARVAVCDVNLTSYTDFAGDADQMTAASTFDEIIDNGGDAIGLEFDVADRSATFAAVEQVAQRWGRVDVVVANAGGSGTERIQDAVDTYPTTIDPDLLDYVSGINLRGTIWTCGAVAPFMKKQRSGKIITISSFAAISYGGKFGWNAHYAANKAAIAHYTRLLAQELGPYGVTANCLSPGLILTGRIAQLSQNGALLSNATGVDTARSGIALGRSGVPEDCARVIEFLATELSDYVSGQVIQVDGGMW
jgi:3-oxoacyl-[acyl-carrier protein] reductase